ncbi:MAG: hypothetical protein J0M30_01695 [Chitinophagales bacterium]|nr:hypothetical protein [Chitinophagales bacterium]
MKYLVSNPAIAVVPIRLTKEEMENPDLVIREFFSFYDLNDIRQELGRWLELAMSSAEQDLQDPRTRVIMIQFGFQLEALVEAVYVKQLSFYNV